MAGAHKGCLIECNYNYFIVFIGFLCAGMNECFSCCQRMHNSFEPRPRRTTNGKSNQFLSRERTFKQSCALNNEIESIKMNRRFKRHLSCSRYRMSALIFSLRFTFPLSTGKRFVLSFCSLAVWKKQENFHIRMHTVCVWACVHACMHFIFHQSVKKWTERWKCLHSEQYDIYSLPFFVVDLS